MKAGMRKMDHPDDTLCGHVVAADIPERGSMLLRDGQDIHLIQERHVHHPDMEHDAEEHNWSARQIQTVISHLVALFAKAAQALVLQNHAHADRAGDVDRVAGEFQFAGFRIDTKYVHVVRSLPGRQQELPGRVDAEVARDFAANRFVPKRREFAGLSVDAKHGDAVVPAV